MTPTPGALAWFGAAVVTYPVARMLIEQFGYVTAGQRAALKVLGASGPTTYPTVDAAASHAVDAAGAASVCELVLQAAHDGATVNDPNAGGGEAYLPLANHDDWFLTTGALTEVFGDGHQDFIWTNLQKYDDGQLTALGVAAKNVMNVRDSLNAGTSSSAVPADLCRELARQMDAQGCLASKPTDTTLFSWTWDHTLGKLVPSTTTIVIGGLLVVAGLVIAHKEGLW